MKYIICETILIDRASDFINNIQKKIFPDFLLELGSSCYGHAVVANFYIGSID